MHHCLKAFQAVAAFGLAVLATPSAILAKPGNDFVITDTPDQITISSPQIEAVISKKDYVSGVKGGSFLDKKTGFRDPSFGLAIADWIMEPGSDLDYRDQLSPELVYEYGNAHHGDIPKRSIEGPQICTKAKVMEPEIIRGDHFVAIKMRFQFTMAAPGKRPGSLWTQTLVFPAGKRYFFAADRIDAVNDSPAMFLRIDMPGHVRHKRGDVFSEIFLSYAGRIPAREFFKDSPPEAKLFYRRDENPMPEHVLRAIHLRDPKTGKHGPWLGSATLKPESVYEAWCHQRGYVCLIMEVGGVKMKAGGAFGAAHVIGYFDELSELREVADRHAGNVGIDAKETGWKLQRRLIPKLGAR